MLQMHAQVAGFAAPRSIFGWPKPFKTVTFIGTMQGGFVTWINRAGLTLKQKQSLFFSLHEKGLFLWALLPLSKRFEDLLLSVLSGAKRPAILKKKGAKEVSQVISIAIRKGGVGKSTSAVNIATALHLKGYKTLLIDLEHTANATISVGINPYSLEKSIADLFTFIEISPQDPIIQAPSGLSVLPATQALEQVEAGMTAAMVGSLKPLLEPLRASFDLMIIDTPPGKSTLATCALVASDSVLIPLEPHYLALLGLDEIMGDIAKVRNGLNPTLSILGILPTKVQIHPKVTRDILSEVERKYPDLLLPYRIKFAIKNVAASLKGEPLVLYDPTDEAAQEYTRLAEDIYEKARF